MAEANPQLQPKPKNKPGRPKKEIETPQFEFFGVINEPKVPGNVMELVYRHPIMFRKLFHLFRAYHVSEITMVFNPTKISIKAIGHVKKSTIYAHINGACMNSYYCANTFTICVKRDNMEKILRLLNKNHFKILITSRAEDFRSVMYISMHSTEYVNKNVFEVPVIYRDDTLDAPTDHSAALYPIKIGMDAKNFKFNLAAILAFSKVFTVQKLPGKSVELSHTKTSSVNFASDLGDTTKLQIDCSLPDSDLLVASVDVLEVKPISQNIFGPNIYIAADTAKPMSFMMQSDDKIALPDGVHLHACVIEIFTNLHAAN